MTATANITEIRCDGPDRSLRACPNREVVTSTTKSANELRSDLVKQGWTWIRRYDLPRTDHCPACEPIFTSPHVPVGASDFMPDGPCGGCDTCSPVPDVCLACSYTAAGEPLSPVKWPCVHATAATPIAQGGTPS